MDLKAAVADVVFWEKEMEINPCPSDGELGPAMDEMVEAGKKDTRGVWNILKNGTEDEFSALCNCLREIGGEFESDEAHREIMRMSKQRLANVQNYDNLMAGIKGGFGISFERFWNETEPTQ